MPEKKSEIDPLELWKKVEKTDPSYTKPVQYGKRKFTAIDAQYQLKAATEQWGPYGACWGLRDLQWSFRDSADSKQVVTEIALDAIFFYPPSAPLRSSDGTYVYEARFPISVDDVWKPGGDARKKLMTDATTKALSKLGFNADVFMGLFDDNKYVQERKREVAAGESYDAAAAQLPDKSGGAPPEPIGEEQRKQIVDASKRRAKSFHDNGIDMKPNAPGLSVLKKRGLERIGDVLLQDFPQFLQDVEGWKP